MTTTALKTTTKTRINNLMSAGIRHGILLVAPTRATSKHGYEVATVELLNLGFLVNPQTLAGVSDRNLAHILEAARAVSGQDRTYRPIYPNFPAQVRDLDTLDLFIDQILHYLTHGTPFVNQEVMARPDLPFADLLVASKPLRVVDHTGLLELAREMLAQPMACSQSDADLITKAIGEWVRSVGVHAFPASDFLRGLSNRENSQLAVMALAEAGISVDKLALWSFAQARSADELLRYVLALYGQAVDAADPDAYQRAVRNLSDRDSRTVGMRSMPRAARRALIATLGAVTPNYRADQLVSRTRLWRAVMRYVHPYAESMPESKAAARTAQRRALDIIHGNVEHRTYAAAVEQALASNKVEVAVPVLEQSAGQLYRYLAKLSTMKGDLALVTGALERVGHFPAMTTLLSAYNGLSALSTGRDRVLRVGGRANVMLSAENTANAADAQILRQAVFSAMVRKFAAIPARDGVASVGVAGDDKVELVRRDAAITDRSISRGARVALPGDGKVLRLFVQWINGTGKSREENRVDLDLGAMLLDRDFGMLASVDYSSYGGARSYATYSGDRVDAPAPDGAAEFIDINLTKVARSCPKAEWVAMSVNSYTGQRLDSVEHLAGAMIRSDGDRGAIFDPRTVATAFTSTAMSTLVSPLAVNLRTRELLWIDTSTGQDQAGYSITMGGSLADAIAFEVAVPRLTEGELVQAYATAHGLPTTDKPVDRELVVALMAL